MASRPWQAHTKRQGRWPTVSHPFRGEGGRRICSTYVRTWFSYSCQFLGTIAHIIKRQRSSIFQTLAADDGIRPPGKNWPQGFYKRHLELQARKVRPLDWARHDIYDKVVGWFTLIGKELSNPAVLQENVYNMDETSVLLSVLNSLKVLVSSKDLKKYRGAAVKRTNITAIECIIADGRHLDPLIIWPAATHRSTWTTHLPKGWQFARQKKGYTDTEISLHWLRHVFNPQTKARANGKPRILISDGFGTHESAELLRFAFENDIRLLRLGFTRPIRPNLATSVRSGHSKLHIVMRLSNYSVEDPT